MINNSNIYIYILYHMWNNDIIWREKKKFASVLVLSFVLNSGISIMYTSGLRFSASFIYPNLVYTEARMIDPWENIANFLPHLRYLSIIFLCLSSHLRYFILATSKQTNKINKLGSWSLTGMYNQWHYWFPVQHRRQSNWNSSHLCSWLLPNIAIWTLAQCDICRGTSSLFPSFHVLEVGRASESSGQGNLQNPSQIPHLKILNRITSVVWLLQVRGLIHTQHIHVYKESPATEESAWKKPITTSPYPTLEL